MEEKNKNIEERKRVLLEELVTLYNCDNVSNKLLIIDDSIVKMNVIFRINEYINYSDISCFREQFEIYMKDFEIPIEKVLVNKIIGRALYGKMAQIFDIILVAENIGVYIYI